MSFKAVWVILAGVGVALAIGVAFFDAWDRMQQVLRWLRKWRRRTHPPEAHWLGLPPSIGERFVGRSGELATLKRQTKKQRILVVAGMPGAGKSQLAVEYAHRHSGPEGFWTTAASDADATIAALAPVLDIDVTKYAGEATQANKTIALAVQRKLAELDRPATWAIDNLPSMEQVYSLARVPAKVRLLITTRDAREGTTLPERTFRLPLDVLAPNAALNLLVSRMEDTAKRRQLRRHPSLPQIAEAVGRLPMALEVLAIRLAQPAQTPEALLGQLSQAPNPVQLQMFLEASGLTLKTEGVFQALTGALATLDASDLAALAPFGCLADAPIPLALAQALTGLEDAVFPPFLSACQRPSALSFDGEHREVRVHSLMAGAIAAVSSPAALEAAIPRAAARLGAIQKTDHLALRREAAHHERLHFHASARFGLEHPEVQEYANNLATALIRLGRYAEAIPLLERTLAVKERVLGPEHPGTLGSRSNLAVAYGEAGRHAEAIPLHEKTLAARERVLGPEHPDTLGSRNNLAIAFRGAGRHAEAIPLLEKTLAALERVLGPEHPDTLASRNNLATAYGDAGRHAEAIDLHEKTLAALERVLGPEHPDTLTSRSNLAVAYGEAGRHAEAIPLLERTLAARSGCWGRSIRAP